jgi:Omp85 superfamily domain
MMTGTSHLWFLETSHASRPRSRGLLFTFMFCYLNIFLSVPAFGQEAEKVGPLAADSGREVTTDPSKKVERGTQSTATDKQDAEPKKKKKLGGLGSGSFVIAPLPVSSPAIGSGIIPVLGYIFPISAKDKVSPPSVIAAVGLITNNGSRGFAVGSELFLKENTYQITSVFVRGNINYDIFGPRNEADFKLPLKQSGEGFLGEFLRRIGWNFYLGPRFLTGRSLLTVRPNNESNFPIPPEVGLHTNLTSLGARLTRDTRPNRFYPVSGTYFTFTLDFFSQGLGSKYSFQSFTTGFDKYWSLSSKQVLAYDVHFCATSGSPPFYGKCIYGTNEELRGYTAGRYFDRYMFATQLEYRLVLPKRFGLVAFGGVGGVVPGASLLPESGYFLPSGGAGLRFLLSKKYHVNLRADIAQGVDGHTFSMGVGEAF